MLRGIRRSQGGHLSRAPRSPITLAHLDVIREYLQRSYAPRDALMLWAALTSAFFGLLRSSEFTAPSASSAIPSTLMYHHISFSSSSRAACLFLPMSKTDPFGSGARVWLYEHQSPCCPVAALVTYYCHHPTRRGPFFTFQDGGFLTRSHVASLLTVTFPSQPTLNTHSFRIGGASALAAAGVPDYIIQSLGRWTSDSFLRYIRLPRNAVRRYQLRMYPGLL